VPLAPGYRILKEDRAVSFASEPPLALRVSVSYALQNSGTINLPFIDVILPNEKLYGLRDLRVAVDGHEVTPSKLPNEPQKAANEVRISLDPAWERRQNRSVKIDYIFSSPSSPDASITLGPDNFHLSSRDWLPLVQPPNRVLAPYPAPPLKMQYSVRVPDNFLVLASGAVAGRKKNGGEIEYRFQLRKGDASLFIVAGRYVDSSSGRQASVSFWTLQSSKADTSSAAQSVATAWSTLQKNFGPLGKNITIPHVVESPELHADNYDSKEPDKYSVAPFPGGVLVRADAWSGGTWSDALLHAINDGLARSWFGEAMYPAPNAAIGLGQGLPNYATIVIDEAGGGESARRKRVIEVLESYQDAVKRAVGTPYGEKPIIATMLDDPIDQRRIARAKATLFFIALEDAYGEEPVRKGLAEVVSLLRGQAVGYQDVRSALEQSTGKNLAEPFRVWIYEKGIPGEFRNKYLPEQPD
jgi:hypothetical protein